MHSDEDLSILPRDNLLKLPGCGLPVKSSRISGENSLRSGPSPIGVRVSGRKEQT